jgi:predicted MFS family arabinose efflux permease
VAVDATVVATLAAPISASFNSSSLLSWLGSAYFIANAAVQPLSGQLTDIYSRQTGIVICCILFAVGNFLCALAGETWVMILGRALAGLGGGGLNSISVFVGSDLVPLRKRGVVQGIANTIYSIGYGLGAISGGWIHETWGWQFAFLIQTPLGLFAGLATYTFVHIPVKVTGKSPFQRIDFLGSATLVSFVVVLLVGVNFGGNVVPWNHPLVLATLPLSLVLLLLFVYVEMNAIEPVIPVRLMVNRSIAGGCLANWFNSMAAIPLIFYMPIYWQLQGSSTAKAGLYLTSYGTGTAVGSLSAGLVMRKTARYWYLNALFLALLVGAIAGITTRTLDAPLSQSLFYVSLAGIGFGGSVTTLFISFISAVSLSQHAVITSASYAFRSTGSAIGIAVASAIFQRVLTQQLWLHIGNRAHAGDIIARLRNDMNEIKLLPVDWVQGVLESYGLAFRATMLGSLGLSILGGACGAMVVEHKLHETLDRKDEDGLIS